MIDGILKDAETRMGKSVDSLRSELIKIRTGRAHPSLLDQIMVDYYGTDTPINQVANVTVEDSRTLAVAPWEKQMVAVVEKAIMNSGLGLNPSTAGTLIRIPMPPLTEERRRELVKVVKNEGENAKIAVRNIRRDANNDFKELLKEKEVSEDESRQAEDSVQKYTDKFVTSIDEVIAVKEKELMEI
ncbi:Ribosome recycling factor [hydrothermal vent metagenome]|uniref:Ribosome recycling factor n=1 Tax=hydrothermal vent metagenome TaxID=652676 RepID=A0A3B0WNT9_9ZZZZ